MRGGLGVYIHMWSKLLSPERRRESRYQASLRVAVIFLGTAADAEQPLAMLGKTHDLSYSGLAVYVPTYPFPAGVLPEAQRALTLLLALPAGDIVAEATLVRCEQLPADHPEMGYLIATQITKMNSAHHALYHEYIQHLSSRR